MLYTYSIANYRDSVGFSAADAIDGIGNRAADAENVGADATGDVK